MTPGGNGAVVAAVARPSTTGERGSTGDRASAPATLNATTAPDPNATHPVHSGGPPADGPEPGASEGKSDTVTLLSNKMSLPR
ncbi:hypothetical protein GCM10018954_098020 [Kutzneria kofuensis]